MELHQTAKKPTPRVIRNEGQDRELAKITASFAWLRMIPGELAGFSTTAWEYYSDGVGKILNYCRGIFLEGRWPARD